MYRLAAVLAAATAIVGGAVYSQTSGHKFNVAKIAEGFGNSLAALLSPDNFNAAVYSFLSAGLGLYSLVLLFGPHEVKSTSCSLLPPPPSLLSPKRPSHPLFPNCFPPSSKKPSSPFPTLSTPQPPGTHDHLFPDAVTQTSALVTLHLSN